MIIKHYVENLPDLLKKRCIVCNYIITGSYQYDAWGENAHTSCDIKNCFCCGRILSNKGKQLSDGRFICEICDGSLGQNTADIQWIDERVLAVLKSVGITGIPKTPIEIVQKQKLLHLMSSNSGFGDAYGLAQYTFNGSVKHFNICILEHLPKTFLAGVLAHEYMHVWQYQNNINPPRDICEGFCNLGAMAMYQKINTKLSSVLLEQVEKSPDPIYGEGYRKVRGYWQTHQWAGTIQKMYTYK